MRLLISAIVCMVNFTALHPPKINDDSGLNTSDYSNSSSEIVESCYNKQTTSHHLVNKSIL